MIRVIFLFLVLAGLAWIGLVAARKLTGQEALSLTKSAGLAILASSIAIALMFGLVVLF